MRSRTAGTCQPKCQIALCGSLTGGVSTRLNSSMHVVGGQQRGEAAPVAFLRAGELPRVPVDRRIGIDRVQMQMMKAWRRQHGGPPGMARRDIARPAAVTIHWPRQSGGGNDGLRNDPVDIEDGVGIVTLNRPDVLNAMNRQLGRELHDAVKAFEADAAVGCIVITGVGRTGVLRRRRYPRATLGRCALYRRQNWMRCAARATATKSARAPSR